MKKSFLISIFIFLFIGCFGMYNLKPPEPRDIEDAIIIEGSFDQIWAAVVETFAELNLNIATIEKDSGIIVSDYLIVQNKGRYMADATNDYCDCGSNDILYEHYRKGKFNIFVKLLNEQSTKITINATYENSTASPSGQSHTINQCISSGKLEAEMFQLIKSKL